MRNGKLKTGSLALPLQQFFSQHLINQKSVSSATVAAYRDTFRLFLRYLEQTCRKSPAALDLSDFTAQNVLAFLDYLEHKRHNKPRSRNARLSALRAFAGYLLAFDAVAQTPQVQRILAIPRKRWERRLVGFLSEAEVHAVLQAPSPTCWTGRRDRLLFQLLYNTGARVSEIIHLRVADVTQDQCRTIRFMGKGRKQRILPVGKSTRRLLQAWLKENRLKPEEPLLPNRFGHPLSRSGVAHQLQVAVTAATPRCSSLDKRNISPHKFRHSTALHMLQAGVKLEVIALWLGHEKLDTTHHYLEASLAMKEKALQALDLPRTKRLRFQPTDRLLRFLDSL
jgi:site-specific recombinase XerD